MKQFTSRYPGFCRKCRGDILVGEEILWQPGHSEHVQCPAQEELDRRAAAKAQANPGQAKPFVPFRRAFNPNQASTQSWLAETYSDPTVVDLGDVTVGGRGRAYFAVPFDGEGAYDGHLFVRIDKPKDGKYAGQAFVRWVYGETEKPIGRQFPKELMRERKEVAGRFTAQLLELSEDPEKAKAKYGQIVGRCGHCRKRLTDATSRERGIGPDCWAMIHPAVKVA